MTIDLLGRLPGEWLTAITPLIDADATAELAAFVTTEYATHTVYPAPDDLFAAYRHCRVRDCRVVILGQDPYHGAGQAHGLSFSVPPGVRVPPSLRNIFKELAEDLGVGPAAPDPSAVLPGLPLPPPRLPSRASGDLTHWARQGVLLLNAVLTVRAGEAGSHAGHGWETFTDATIRALNGRDQRIVFLLWGGYARRKAELITAPQHVVLEAGHPSPLNPRGFAGSRPFSRANKALVDAGLPPIDW
ncbi:uracil-DNA glycosylase [Pilimelia anulata]|uniref:Uracil-DNA glycosylase n=1 Tax=Pilimelia anulata TaxID=53371 RepID=A0A8J3FE73_9ACTN|nr:uracil-DNA glycosylase [Pilimelia anulata]GGJ99125.1 uracil-DNA glycosylase [Pilimelia anulata]